MRRELVRLRHNADYYEVVVDGKRCEHSHRSIESAASCLQDKGGSRWVVAVRKRKDAIGAARMYSHDEDWLSAKEVQSLIECKEK